MHYSFENIRKIQWLICWKCLVVKKFCVYSIRASYDARVITIKKNWIFITRWWEGVYDRLLYNLIFWTNEQTVLFAWTTTSIKNVSSRSGTVNVKLSFLLYLITSIGLARAVCLCLCFCLNNIFIYTRTRRKKMSYEWRKITRSGCIGIYEYRIRRSFLFIHTNKREIFTNETPNLGLIREWMNLKDIRSSYLPAYIHIYTYLCLVICDIFFSRSNVLHIERGMNNSPLV